MDNKKIINPVFGLILVACLALTIHVIDRCDTKGISEQKDNLDSMAQIVRLKHNKIIVLSRQLAENQKESDKLRNMLVDTRNSLVTLTKKLSEPNLPPAAVTK